MDDFAYPTYPLALALLYQALMLYGLSRLFLHHRHGEDAAAGFRYLAFGLIGPVMAWLLAFLVPATLILLPVSLVILYLLLSLEDRRNRRTDHQQHLREKRQPVKLSNYSEYFFLAIGLSLLRDCPLGALALIVLMLFLIWFRGLAV